MNGDPIDPIPLNRAIKELAHRWTEDTEMGAGENSSNLRIWEMSASQLKGHYGSFEEAALHVFRHAVLSLKIRVWTGDGPEWKRPTLAEILSCISPASGLYVDKAEVCRVLGHQWPRAFPSSFPDITTVPMPLQEGGDKRSPRRRGRKPGSGSYAEDDAPLLVEMKSLMDARKATSMHDAAGKIANKAKGAGTLESRAKRLERGFGTWEKNGFD